MKKLICIALTVIMALSCAPLSVFAGVLATNAARIGDVEYKTLDAAIQAAAVGDTITLLKDCDMTKAAERSTGSYTIDGSNRKYTVTLKAIIETKDCDITFKGVNLITNYKADQSTRIENENNQRGDMVFDNCYIETAQLGIKGCGYGNVTFKNNTLLYSTSLQGGGMYFRGDHEDADEDDCVITVENSTIKGTQGDINGTNSSIFHFNSSAATYKLKLVGNAVLEQASESKVVTTPCIIYGGDVDHMGGALEIYADPTAKFLISTEAGTLGGAYFIRRHKLDGNFFSIKLYGTPQFVVNSYVASKGITMPELDSIASLDKKINYTKWSDGTATYASGWRYTGTGLYLHLLR